MFSGNDAGSVSTTSVVSADGVACPPVIRQRKQQM